MKQRKKLLEFEKTMSVGPVAAARLLDTAYDTYKNWKSERCKMPDCAWVAIELWMDTVSPANEMYDE